MTPSLFERLEDRRFFSVGVPDTTFLNGQTTESIKVNSTVAEGANNDATPRQVLVDSADRMLVVVKTDGYLVLRRFLPGNGTADASFDQSVAAQPIAVGTSRLTNATSVALDPSNRVYVLVGKTITRYTSSGKIDRSYGHKGSVTLDQFSDVSDFAINNDGQIYAVGTAPLKGTRTRMVVARLTSAGVLDKNFDSDGIYNAPVPGGPTITNAYAVGQRLRVIPGGAIIVAGETHFRVNVSGSGPAYYEADEGIETLKFRANGRLFADYGTDGVAFDNAAPVDTSFETLAVTGIRNDGSVVLYDSGSDDNPDGDGGYNGNVSVTNTGTRGGAIDFGGQILIDGDFFAGNDGSEYYSDTLYHQVIRLTKQNTLDTTFNGGRSFPGPSSAAVAPDGRIFYAGSGNAIHDNKILIGALTTSDGPYGVVGSQVLSQQSRAFGFTVDYHDMDGIDTSSINGLELRITGGTFRDRPLLVSKASDGNGGILATYSLRRDSLRGAWTAADNGNYVVSVFRQTLKDDLGNYAPSTPIGTLTVSIA